MAFKQFALDERTQVTIYKRRGSRNLRLTIASNGQIRVSIPTWAPYRAGLEFARARTDWIAAQQRPTAVLEHGQLIGKAHHLSFTIDDSKLKPVSRVKSSHVVVTHPAEFAVDSPDVQKVAQTAAVRALRAQAEQLLPQRLATLAVQHGFEYGSVSAKRLKSRWGSCDHQGNIVLNVYLMQLPWELIDYVLLHELTHTQVLRHGPDFWRAMERVLPAVKTLRKRIRDHHPVLNGSGNAVMA